MATISSIAERINQAAHGYEFGNLQEMRRRLKSKTRVPMTIFNTANKSVNDQQGWACHTGGREELQFNIGVETAGMLRFGVAFSLETSRSMHHIELFYPKIERFNEYLRLHAAEFEDMRMWIERKEKLIAAPAGVRSIIDSEAVRGNFIFMGKAAPIDTAGVEQICAVFDRLFPLYCFVEGGENDAELEATLTGDAPFHFEERLSVGREQAERSPKVGLATVELRSNQIKKRLCEQLRATTPGARLGDEIASGNGGRIDLVALLPTGRYVYYEIKPAGLARDAIRQALPQLLEYCYRQGSVEAERLVIVSQAVLDAASAAFLVVLRDKGLPVFYLHVPLD